MAVVARIIDRLPGIWRALTLPHLSLRTYVALIAGLTFLLRWPSLAYPLGPDESGYLLVARNWAPRADSVYGPYFVDRTPELIALFRGIDTLAGDAGLRLLGALAAVILVATMSRVGWLLAERVGADDVHRDRAARWAALAAGAWATCTMLGAMYTKGEILGIPLVAVSMWCALAALRSVGIGRAVTLATGAGLFAMAAVGLKQNMLSGFAFGGVLLLAAALTRSITWGRFAALAVGSLAGASVPVVATIVWARTAGVRLSEVWYASVAFRDDASSVLAAGSYLAPLQRGLELFAAAVAAGLVLAVIVLLLDVRRLWGVDRAITAAVVATVLVDVVSLSLGGSYWRPYLLNLIPGVCLGMALVVATGRGSVSTSAPAAHAGQALRGRGLRGRGLRGRGSDWWMGCCLLVAVAASLISSVGSAGALIATRDEPDASDVGRVIGDVADSDDTLMTFGGQAGIVYHSELDSPYPYLWSLPMRVLDPHLEQMRAQLNGERPPTWMVLAVPIDSWNIHEARQVRAILRRDYVYDGDSCGVQIYHLRSADRVSPRCSPARPPEWDPPRWD